MYGDELSSASTSSKRRSVEAITGGVGADASTQRLGCLDELVDELLQTSDLLGVARQTACWWRSATTS